VTGDEDVQTGRRTLQVDGVVDFLSASALQRAGVSLISPPGTTELLVDMSRTSFIDSSGLSVLVYLKGRCDERGIGMSLVAVPPRARNLIDSLGLSVYFDLPPARPAD
jgi:anti-anti-sigma factor